MRRCIDVDLCNRGLFRRRSNLGGSLTLACARTTCPGCYVCVAEGPMGGGDYLMFVEPLVTVSALANRPSVALLFAYAWPEQSDEESNAVKITTVN